MVTMKRQCDLDEWPFALVSIILHFLLPASKASHMASGELTGTFRKPSHTKDCGQRGSCFISSFSELFSS